MHRVAVTITTVGLLLIGCTKADTTSGTSSTTPSVTSTSTPVTKTSIVKTPTATPFVAQTQVALGNQPPNAPIPDSDIKSPCPYIGTADAQQAQGNHIYLTTVSKQSPVRCRFYFYSSPFNAVLEIAPAAFDTPVAAHDALVRTAQATTQPSSIGSYPNFVPGVDLISFRAAMFAPDNGLDWACAFAKGNTLVLIRTQQKDTSQDARNVAAVVIAKF